MLSPKSHAFLNSSYGNMPIQLHHAGAQKVIINPQDAALRGIAAGDPVRVFNERGAFEAVAELSLDTMTGVVVAPMGYWPRNSRSAAHRQRDQSTGLRRLRSRADILRHAGRGGEIGAGRGGVIGAPPQRRGALFSASLATTQRVNQLILPFESLTFTAISRAIG